MLEKTEFVTIAEVMKRFVTTTVPRTPKNEEQTRSFLIELIDIWMQYIRDVYGEDKNAEESLKALAGCREQLLLSDTLSNESASAILLKLSLEVEVGDLVLPAEVALAN